MPFEHEQVAIVSGARAGMTTILAVHSTALGPAAGGCRLFRYADWRAGLEDALRLSEAMTLKAALAELPVGGGKSVIAQQPDDEMTEERRRDALLDLGDLVESFGGRYGVGEDVGTTAEDMLVVRERTAHVYCLPASHGGSGEPAEATAMGVYVSLGALVRRIFGAPTMAGRRMTVVGLGQVGGRLAQRLAADQVELTLSDIDPTKKALAAQLGASWLEPDEAHVTPCDVLIPAAMGGVLTPDLVALLNCRAICGPANNQLSVPDVADALDALGILWAPDFVVNAGGLIHGVLADRQGKSPAQVSERTERIAGTLMLLLDAAEREQVAPLVAAERLARERIANARVAS